MQWVLFNLFILSLLAADLFIFHKKAKKIGKKESLLWSFFWIALALLFNLFIYFWKGAPSALAFFTGYIVEKALSVDNLFVIALILSYFKIAEEKQHALLFWGVLGASVMRITFILGGIALIQKFAWLPLLLGGFLLFTGMHLLVKGESKSSFEGSRAITLIKKLFPRITPFALALITIEYTDLIFALDSIPAVLAITQDSFIVYSSNLFAILGLRSLYFVLAVGLKSFVYMQKAIAAILIFVGIKMVLSPLYEIPVHYALLVIASILALAIYLSLKVRKL